MQLPFRLLKVLKWGSSCVLILPRDLREELRIQPGDFVSVRVYQSFAVFRRCVPETIMPESPIPVEAIPPATIARFKGAARLSSAPVEPAPAVKSDAGKHGRGEDE
jgi:hypothetical protein